MFGRGLENLLEQEPTFKIVGSETNIVQALEKIRELQPNVVMIYADDAQRNSDILITDIFRVSPQAKVIAMSVHNNIFYVYQAARQTANSVEDLIKAIQALSDASFSGNSWANQNRSSEKFH
jgi:DNA-binding NarL/FixJ family response regulator